MSVLIPAAAHTRTHSRRRDILDLERVPLPHRPGGDARHPEPGPHQQLQDQRLLRPVLPQPYVQRHYLRPGNLQVSGRSGRSILVCVSVYVCMFHRPILCSINKSLRPSTSLISSLQLHARQQPDERRGRHHGPLAGCHDVHVCIGARLHAIWTARR